MSAPIRLLPRSALLSDPGLPGFENAHGTNNGMPVFAPPKRSFFLLTALEQRVIVCGRVEEDARREGK